MITILGVKLTYETIGFLALFLASEVIGSNEKLKANSVIQLLLGAANALKPLRSEDERINKIRDSLK